MSAVSRDEIERIAQLACVGIDDHTSAKLTQQITQILEYFAQLASLEGECATTDDVTSVASNFRDDVVSEPQRVLDPAAFAPSFQERLFAVPRLRSMEDE